MKNTLRKATLLVPALTFALPLASLRAESSRPAPAAAQLTASSSATHGLVAKKHKKKKKKKHAV